ncbi:MCE family protein [candidate division KSB1 bacterium]|nr:MCE family protein [candidate division KSB1 bacterium]
MDGRRAELQVGAAVILSLAVLIGGIMWGKGFSLKVSRRPITVEFQNVGGLEPGSNVLANGVVQGRVSEIVLKDGRVKIEATLDNDVVLFSDYRIVIESPTLMAGKVLSVYPGALPPTINTAGVTLRGAEPLGVGEAVSLFMDLSGDLKATMVNLNNLLIHLNEVVGDTANQTSIRDLLKNAGDVAGQSADLLRENRAQLKLTLAQLSATIETAQRVAELADRRMGTTIDGVDSLVLQLADLASSLQQVTTNLNSDSTTAGRLLNDDELYIRLNSALSEVDSLANSIRTKGLRNKIVLF